MAVGTYRAAVLVCGLVGMVACGNGAGEPASPEPASTASTASMPEAPEAHDTGHAHDAPHGGSLIELGDHFAFLEFVVEPATGTLTMYVLDGSAEQAVRIAQPTVRVTFESPTTLAGQTLELAAQANVLTGETVGDSSQFTLVHEALKDQASFAGRVVDVSIKGQPFRDLAVTHTAGGL